MSNFSGSTKPADDNSVQQSDLVKTSRGTAGVAGKPSMEEISARLSAKLALLEASQQVMALILRTQPVCLNLN